MKKHVFYATLESVHVKEALRVAKLWQKNYTLDSVVERFTVGIDYILDTSLVMSDCLSSIAHAKMLSSIKILSYDEFDSLRHAIIRIMEDADRGDFKITLSDEDCHTAIENRLTAEIGDAGKKIHTGRSRNDQVLTAVRFFSRSKILKIMEAVSLLVGNLIKTAEKYSDVPMPGRTHMQIAMPSSVGLWAGAFAEELSDCIRLLESVYHINNQSPLGSAASYGVPLPLDRKMTSDLLGFEKVQNNVLYCNNARGKIESMIIDSLDQITLTLSKMAQDLIIYSMPEFGYFSLPANLCSGSSIMPQKKNPDALELLRAKSASVSAASIQVKNIIRSLPTGYNRDFQETKEPLMKSLDTAFDSITIMSLTIDKIEVNRQNLKKGFIPEIYATDEAIRLVGKGLSFRDAYREIGLNIEKLADEDPEKVIASRSYEGTTGCLNLLPVSSEKERIDSFLFEESKKIDRVINTLTGRIFQVV